MSNVDGDFKNFSIHPQESSSSASSSSSSSAKEKESKAENDEVAEGNHGGRCAICLEDIALEETAFVVDCEHTYCVTCILQWAAYNENPACPQCKQPFAFLCVHRAIDGRAPWFKPLVVEDGHEDISQYIYEDDDIDPADFSSSLRILIGNRRWGNNGFVRGGRLQARPVNRSSSGNSPAANRTGRRARRALKRDAAEKESAVRRK